MQYFLTILPTQFQPVIDRWKEILEIQYSEKFEEIKILNINKNQYFDKSIKHYMFFDKSLDYPSFNSYLSKNAGFKALIEDILKKQTNLFVVPYSTSNLFLKDKRIFLLGPKSSVATFFDNKINAYKLFKKLALNTPKFNLIFKKSNFLVKKSIFITAAFSSGSDQSRIINNQSDYLHFFNKIRPINQSFPLIALEHIENIEYFVETSCLIFNRNKIEVLSILDEVKNNTSCIGNIYPSIISREQKKKLTNISTKIGTYLANKGYLGMFGCGFFITKNGEVYISDLNPRRQGFYMGDACLHKNNLPRVEFEIYMGKGLLKCNNPNKKICNNWAYSLIYTENNIKLNSNFKNSYSINKLRSKGMYFFPFYNENVYFRKGFPLGYMIISDIPTNQKDINMKKDMIVMKNTKTNKGIFLLKDIIFHKFLSFL